MKVTGNVREWWIFFVGHSELDGVVTYIAGLNFGLFSIQLAVAIDG